MTIRIAFLLALALAACGGTTTTSTRDGAAVDAAAELDGADEGSTCAEGQWSLCTPEEWWPPCKAGYYHECLDGGFKSCVCETSP